MDSFLIKTHLRDRFALNDITIERHKTTAIDDLIVCNGHLNQPPIFLNSTQETAINKRHQLTSESNFRCKKERNNESRTSRIR